MTSIPEALPEGVPATVTYEQTETVCHSSGKVYAKMNIHGFWECDSTLSPI